MIIKNLKYLVMDVDGTLTDGKIYMSPGGEMFKAFDIKDGCGIGTILPLHNIIPVVITARDSQIVLNRARELNITHIYQSCHDKLSKVIELTDGHLEQVAFIGDDLPDLSCMEAVKRSGGLIGCPRDAAIEVKKVADFVSTKDGGNGAVREFIDWITKNGS